MTTSKRRYSFDQSKNYDELKYNQEKENNNWNSIQERVLQQRGEQALGYRWMHNQACKKLSLVNNVMGILGIVFGAVGGTTSLTNISICNTKLEIFAGVSAYASAVLVGGIKFLQYDKQANKHQQSAIKFQALSSDIINQLAMKRRDRKSGNEYLETTKIQFDKIIAEAPDIPQQILDKFKTKFGETKISKPIVANGIDTIAIHHELRREPSEKAIKSPTEEEIITDTINSELQKEFERQLKERKNKRTEESTYKSRISKTS